MLPGEVKRLAIRCKMCKSCCKENESCYFEAIIIVVLYPTEVTFPFDLVFLIYFLNFISFLSFLLSFLHLLCFFLLPFFLPSFFSFSPNTPCSGQNVLSKLLISFIKQKSFCRCCFYYQRIGIELSTSTELVLAKQALMPLSYIPISQKLFFILILYKIHKYV